MNFEVLPNEIRDQIVRKLDNKSWLNMAQTSTRMYNVCYLSHKERLKQAYIGLLRHGIYPVKDAVTTDNADMLASIMQYSENWRGAFREAVKYAAYDCMNWIYDNRREALEDDLRLYVNRAWSNALTLKWFHARGHVGDRYLVEDAIHHNYIGVLEETYTKKEHYFRNPCMLAVSIYSWFKNFPDYMSPTESGISGETFTWLAERGLVNLSYNILYAALDVHAWDLADAYQQAGGELCPEHLPLKLFNNISVMTWILEAYPEAEPDLKMRYEEGNNI